MKFITFFLIELLLEKLLEPASGCIFRKYRCTVSIVADTHFGYFKFKLKNDANAIFKHCKNELPHERIIIFSTKK